MLNPSFGFMLNVQSCIGPRASCSILHRASGFMLNPASGFGLHAQSCSCVWLHVQSGMLNPESGFMFNAEFDLMLNPALGFMFNPESDLMLNPASVTVVTTYAASPSAERKHTRQASWC
jgi:hypothetical protein